MNDRHAEQRAFIEEAVAPLVADLALADPPVSITVALDDDGDGLMWCWTTGDAWGWIANADFDPGSAPPAGVAEMTAAVATDVLDNAFDDWFDPWPACPRHGDHALDVELRRGRAVWVCSRPDGNVVCALGALKDLDS